MKRPDAIQINTLAGNMLLAVEKHVANGRPLPILPTQLPLRDALLLREVQRHRQKIADKLNSLIDKD
jgi:hypothetical protein